MQFVHRFVVDRLSHSLSQDSVGKVTMLSRRRLEELPGGVDVAVEEREGRLVQHTEDLDAMTDDAVRQICAGAHVFCNTLGTTRSTAGSAVGKCTHAANMLALHVTLTLNSLLGSRFPYILTSLSSGEGLVKWL